MKKLHLLFILFIFISLRIVAQVDDKKISELLFLYADEKYDKLTNKSLALTLNDKYKKHPMPFLCVALGYYEMSRSPGKFDVGERDSKYPKPIKNARKYLAKYLKAEKKVNKYFPDYESTYADYTSFYESIADTSNTIAQHFYIMEKPSKAASIYKATYKAVPDNPVLLLWQGISEIKSNNKTEGDKNIISALNKIDEDYKPVNSTSSVIAQGMLIAEEYLSQKGDMENAKKAKRLVGVFKKYDPDEIDKKEKAERKEESKEKDAIMRKFYSDEDDEENIEKKKAKVVVGDDVKETEDELDRLEREAQEE